VTEFRELARWRDTITAIKASANWRVIWRGSLIEPTEE
jgi:hypothetical protein